MHETAHLETEVKFFTCSHEALRHHIINLGGTSQGKSMEVNIRYDDPAGNLQARGQLLRLRQDTAARLTFKRRPEQTDSRAKSYLEYELVVEDFATMDAILNQIGFQGVQRYEKVRETFVLESCTICLDTMPFGNFLEIEGPIEAIARLAVQLGLEWSERILENYLAIFEKLRRQAGLEFNDLTFANFKAQPVAPEILQRIIKACQAG